jgi:hypothetical protein
VPIEFNDLANSITTPVANCTLFRYKVPRRDKRAESWYVTGTTVVMVLLYWFQVKRASTISVIGVLPANFQPSLVLVFKSASVSRHSAGTCILQLYYVSVRVPESGKFGVLGYGSLVGRYR